ncbi:MAG: heparinase II/III family protein, partial [Gemmiger sp.]|nr:heparinase II/III family protein [Gemmiger sp.]
MNKTATTLWADFCSHLAPDAAQKKEIAALCHQFWPADCALNQKTANEVLNQCFLFQLPWDMEQTWEPVQFSGPINWEYQLHGDQEFTFQLNRHRYWVSLGQAYALTGDERYARCFTGQLQGWLKQQPCRPA